MFICEVGVMSCLIMPHINLLVASFLFYFGGASQICHGTVTKGVDTFVFLPSLSRYVLFLKLLFVTNHNCCVYT